MIKASLKEVFKKPGFTILALVIAILIFLITIMLPNYDLIKYALHDTDLGIAQKFGIIFSLIGSFKTNLTLANQVTVLIVSPLAGINIAMVAYYFHKRKGTFVHAGGSIVGVIASFIGIGCASCGSVLLSSLIGISATAGIVGVLPFNGIEFELLSIGVLIWSTYVVAKRIQAPLVC